MNLVKYARVMLSGPVGEVQVVPLGQTGPLSGAFDKVIGETRDGLKDMYIYQGQTVSFGAVLNATVLGSNTQNQIKMSDGMNQVKFVLRKQLKESIPNVPVCSVTHECQCT